MGISIFAFIIVLGVLIFFHELGHFLVARLFGVGVERFSLGFGPKIIGKKIGITDYRISAVPLGGYVKMVGEEPDARVDTAQLSLSFAHQHVVKRILIVAAGPFFNILLAVTIFFLFYSITGIEDIKPVIRHVEKDSAAMQAGLRVNDRIMSIDGKRIESWYGINEAIAESDGKTLSIGAIRDNQPVSIPVVPALKHGNDILGDEISYYDIGISAFPELKPIVSDVNAGFPAAKAGLQKGDQIVSINGIPVESWRQMQTIISSSGGVELTISVKREETVFKVNLTPKMVGRKDHLGKEENRYLIGISAQQITLPEEDRVTVRLNPVKAAAESLKRTYFVFELTVKSVVKIIAGSIPKDNLGGPIMIAKLAGEQAKAGIDKLVQFIALISINLAILNVLPIPVLDGGHLLFFFIEMIIGRPVSVKVREIAQQAGMFILIMLMILVFYNDITRYFFSR
ncbi:MAG: RIP metalloprotease RseP [Desulfobacterales bacterium]|jgi:regulator of sigma E protease